MLGRALKNPDPECQLAKEGELVRLLEEKLLTTYQEVVRAHAALNTMTDAAGSNTLHEAMNAARANIEAMDAIEPNWRMRIIYEDKEIMKLRKK